MRNSLVLLLLALCIVSAAKAATHVNISIGHNLATNPADVTYVDGQTSAELRAGPANAKHHSDFGYVDHVSNEHLGRLYSADGSNANFKYSQGSARLTAENDNANVEIDSRQQQQQQQQQQRYHQTAGYNSRTNEQDKQNQEFERYIQSYHSGPTVETVFESSTPSSSQRQTSSSSSSSSSTSSLSSSFAPSSGQSGKSERVVAIGSRRPTQVHTFERQVVLSTVAPTGALLPPADERQSHTIINHQPKSSNGVVDIGSSSSVSSSSSSSSSGFDQSNGFDQAGVGYSKPKYNYDDNDVRNQYPPAVDETQGDFNAYSGHEQTNGFYGGSTPAPGYLPSYPRPVVTKTIQIAQPALKAKKYEIRHPAVQKEFYDIEERVVIKPAGTIVVELERPVAKIPKGETILPLGHPHPAVASAYNTNGAAVVQTMGSDVVSSSSSSSSSNNNNNNQYSPVYNPKSSIAKESQYPQTSVLGSTTIGSSLTTTPNYDGSSQNEFVDTNVNKKFNADAQYVTTTERNFNDENKQRNDGFYVTTTESNRNYGTQFYGRDETDRRYSGHIGSVEVKNNGAPGISTSFVGSRPQTGYAVSGQTSFGTGRSQFQPNYNENNQYKGEFLSGEFYNHQQGPKPARLQQQPRSYASSQAVQTSTMHVIKHEHNIHLPASQHNIYLGRLEKPDLQQSSRLTNGPRFNEEAGQVLELKQYLKQHSAPVVVYAPNSVGAATSSYNSHYSQRQNYEPAARYAQTQSHSQRLQYSAPYSQMRHHPDQSARYVYGSESNYRSNANYEADNSNSNNANNNGNDGYQSDAANVKSSSTQPQAHIHIQIPHHPQEAGKPIVVSSTISPAVHDVKEERTANYRQPAASSSAVYYDDNQTARLTAGAGASNGYQHGKHQYNYESSANLETFKPDCDESTANNAADYKQQKSLRIIESSNAASGSSESSTSTTGGSIPSGSVDVNLKSTAGSIAAQSGSRVIAATPAPTDAAASSESFHKRRIVVNHPFQTVREVVEHEPITNYHHVQVSEPASPELYHHTAPYYHQESHGAIRQVETLPLLYRQHSATTHGNLHYAPAIPFVHGVPFGYHHG